MLYDAYVDKIRKFRQNDAILCCTEALWMAWKFENQALTDSQKKELILVRAYAPRILCIAAATGNNHRTVLPLLKDILQLSQLHLEVSESISNPKLIEADVDLVMSEIAKTPLGQYSIPKDLVHVCVSSLFLQRLLRSQWDASAYSMRHVFRGWKIYEYLDQRTEGKSSKAVTTIFGQTPIQALRSAFCTFTMAMDNNDGKKMQGIFDLDQSSIESKIETLFKIDRETIRQIAAKLSRSTSTYREWHDKKVLTLPEVYRKYAPLPLYQSPLFPAEGIWKGTPMGSIENVFLSPSPHIHLASLSDMFVRELISNSQLSEGINISSELGLAGEDYLEEALPILIPNSKITRINANNQRAADFIVECEEAVFIIEAKKCLGGVEAKTISSPIDSVGTWCRLLESYEQCSATIKRDLKTLRGKKPIISLVVVNDTVLGEQGIFDLIAHHVGIHNELGIDNVEVFSLDQLERLFQRGTVQAITEEILNKWRISRENPNLSNFYSLPVETRGQATVRKSHLGSVFDAVFPGLDLKE